MTDQSKLPPMSQGDKYKAFRNFMSNELQITHSDIKVWTIQGVQQEIEKITQRMDLKSLIEKEAKKLAIAAVSDGDRYSNAQKELRKMIAVELAARIQLRVPTEYTNETQK